MSWVSYDILYDSTWQRDILLIPKSMPWQFDDDKIHDI